MATSLDPRCSVETSRVGVGSAVEVAGVLDWHSAPLLRAALASLTRPRRVLLDLTEVVRMDSSGTGEVIATTVRAGHESTGMAIVTGPATADILESVGIGDNVLLFSDRAAAYTWVSGERAGYPLGR